MLVTSPVQSYNKMNANKAGSFVPMLINMCQNATCLWMNVLREEKYEGRSSQDRHRHKTLV